MNRVVLAGRITKDPELRNSANGTLFTSFSIAVNRQMPNAQGERVADFINCVAFNKQAENLSRFIRKGGLIGVDGRLQTRTYQAQDGSTRYATEVICDTITFLESRNSQNNQNNTNAYNDYSSYENNYNQAPQQTNQSRNQFNQQSFTPSYNNVASRNQMDAPQVQPSVKKEEPKEEDNFSDVERQFDITDDDLPF